MLLELAERLLNVPTGLRRRIRRRLILRSIRRVGRNFFFDPLDVYGVSHLVVGDDVFIAPGARILSGEGAVITLGHGVMIGPNVTILGGDHDFEVLGKRMRDVTQHGKRTDITLEDDVWCGANVTILKGVHVGEGAVVGAGSVVVKSLPPYSVCAGNPCRPRKFRFGDDALREHLRMLGRSAEDAEQVLHRRREAFERLNRRGQE